MFRTSVRAIVILNAITACNFDRAPLDSKTRGTLSTLELRMTTTPEDPNAHYSLAQAYENAGLSMKAADAYLKVIQLNPTNADSMGALGRIYKVLGYYTASYRQLHHCLQVDPKHAECLYDIGALLQKDGSKAGLTQSLTFWRKFMTVAKNHPKTAEVRRRLNEIETQIDTTPARGVPASPSPSTPQANTIIPGHQNPQGQEDVGKLNPFGVAIGKAISSIRVKDSTAAEGAFREALQIRPNDAGALAGLAETLFHQKKLEAAQKTITQAYDADPNNTQARWVYGLIMIKSGKNIERALQAWEALHRDTPDFAAQVGVTKTLQAVQKMRSGQSSPD